MTFLHHQPKTSHHPERSLAARRAGVYPVLRLAHRDVIICPDDLVRFFDTYEDGDGGWSMREVYPVVIPAVVIPERIEWRSHH
jgi:hypothetical protein